jgi:hypothetical protein
MILYRMSMDESERHIYLRLNSENGSRVLYYTFVQSLRHTLSIFSFTPLTRKGENDGMISMSLTR